MARGAEGMDGWGREVLHCSALFYVDGGMVAYTDPAWIQGVLDTTTGFFNRVGIHTNAGKTVGIICRH